MDYKGGFIDLLPLYYKGTHNLDPGEVNYKRSLLMSKKFSTEYIAQAHKATIFNELDIIASKICTCCYCGYQFNANAEQNLEWWDIDDPKGKTLVCPKCGIDVVIGDASGFPVTDKDFILECSANWFNGYSKLCYGEPVEKIKRILIEVD